MSVKKEKELVVSSISNNEESDIDVVSIFSDTKTIKALIAELLLQNKTIPKKSS